MKKTILLLALIASVFVLTACSSKTSQEDAATATTAPLNLIAEGSLLPLNSLDHSFSISGQVSEVLVKNGDSVKKGDVLARLNDSPAAALALENAELEALSAQQALDLLKTSSDMQLAQAQLDLANAKQEYDKVRWNQLYSDQARGTNEDTINAARAAVTLAEDKVADAEEKYNDFVETADSDPLKAAALSTLANAKLNLDRAKLNLNFYLTPPNEQDLAISEGKVAVAKAKYEEAQRQWEKLKEGLDADALALAEGRVSAANAAVANAQAQLDALEIKANMDGTVVDLTLQPGQKVTAGEAVIVVADYSSWIIKTDNLTEVEVVDLQEGQKVEVVLDALPDVSLEGEISKIDNRFIELRGDITYPVTITLTKTDPRMRWGMTAAVYFLP